MSILPVLLVLWLTSCDSSNDLASGSNLVDQSASNTARVVSLSPHLTELMFALGHEKLLVGTVEHSNWPEAAKEIPRIGNAFNINLESIIALQPDSVLAWTGGTSPSTIKQLRSIGLKVDEFATGDLESLSQTWQQLDEHLLTFYSHKPKTNLQVVQAEFEKGIRQLKTADRPPQRAIFLLSMDPYYAVGGEGLLHQAMAFCGYQNQYRDVNQPSFSLNLEQLIADAKKAKVIVNASVATAEHQSKLLLTMIPENRQLSLHNPDLYRATPSIIDGLQELCRLNHAAAQ